MARNRSRVLTIHELAGLKSSSRRDFLKKVSLGGGTIVLFNRYLVRGLFAQTEEKKTVFSMVVVDFNKCTGCRTCETVCSSSNHTKLVDGKESARSGESRALEHPGSFLQPRCRYPGHLPHVR